MHVKALIAPLIVPNSVHCNGNHDLSLSIDAKSMNEIVVDVISSLDGSWAFGV